MIRTCTAACSPIASASERVSNTSSEHSARLRGDTRPDWWQVFEMPPVPAGYDGAVADTRDLLDALTAAVPDEQLVAELSGTLRRLSERLQATAVDEYHQLAGRIDGVPGRGQVLVPPMTVDHLDEHSIRGTVIYTRFYLGGNGAVHGGAVPLLFDDILGRFAQTGGRPTSRTAYLHIDYRSITPVERSLTLAAEVVQEEGRKVLVRGTLHDGDVLCAEAEGLFVVLRPGQA